MMRPLADHHDSKAIDESTDTYDTVAWLLKNVPGNNGRVGVVGTSYPGFLAMMAGIDPHPAVKAISPQAPMIDVWIGDDFFHNGAFRQSYGYDYVLGMESSKEPDRGRATARTKTASPSTASTIFSSAASLPRCEAIRLQSCCPPGSSSSIIPPTITYWSLARRRARAQHRRRAHAHRRRLLRPGRYVRVRRKNTPSSSRTTRITRTSSCSAHGVTALGRRHRAISAISTYGEPIGKEFRAQIEAKFFAHYLKDEPGFDLEDTASFQTGSNTWKYYAHFPPRESRPTACISRAPACSAGVPQPQPRNCILRQRSRQSRSLSPSPHPAHLRRRLAVVQLAH